MPKASKSVPAKPAAQAAKSSAKGSPAPKGGHLYLVDGSGYLFRAFHALPPLSRPDGTPVGAVLGFTNMLLRLMAGHEGDHLAVIFDASADTFRNKIYPEYKANRDETPPELIPQFPLVREATRAFGIPAIELKGFEADDLIACYSRAAREAGMKATIVSSDKDMMQLIGDGVDMLDPIKYSAIRAPEVLARFGVTPDKVTQVQALIGDSVDNVPGVPGIGPTAAAACINMFGDLAGVLKAVQNPEKFTALFKEAAEAADKALFKLTGRSCKYGPTSRELGALLFEEMKLSGGAKDAKGGWNISNDALEALAKTHKVAQLVLDCREKSRAASAAAGWAEKINTNRALAEISLELVTLKDDCPLPEPLGDLAIRKPDPEVLLEFLVQQGFRSLINRMKSEGLVDGDFDVDTVQRMTIKQPPGQAAVSPVTPAKSVTGPKLPTGAGKYELVQDAKALAAWILRATQAGRVAVDTETTSLDALRAELVGVSLSVIPGEACYIPVGHVAPGSAAAAANDGGLDLGGGKTAPPPPQLAREAALSLLKPLLADPAVLKVGHNIKYDSEIFARYGLTVAPIDDTMLLSYVLAGGKHGHGMDELSDIHLGHKTITYDEVTGTGKARISFAEVPLERARDYAAEDADITLRLHEVLKPQLSAEQVTTVYETIERPLIPVLQEMEQTGIAVDVTELKRLSTDFGMRMVELEKQIHKEAGRPFNVGSPAQLGTIMFDELGLKLPEGDAPKKTKTGAYGTGADVLEDLAAVGHKMPALVLEWRQISKLKSTYTDALIEQINPDTKRVHTNYGMAIASTGRLSSNDPNLQNIPVRTEEGRKIRKAFVAAKDHVLLSFDYSQIELRLLAHVADIETLRTAFHAGEDIHALTASQVFNTPVKGMDPMVRRKAKAINFGIIYGISAFGLARQLGIPQGEARDYIARYFERYPGIRDYMESTKAFARKHGYVSTVFGRRCHTPEIASKNGAMRSFAERAAINAPIQGGAADIIKRAMVRMPAALAGAKLSARMLLQVHDELLFEVAPREVDATIKTVKGVMEGAAAPSVNLSVPLVVEVGKGQSWADAH